MNAPNDTLSESRKQIVDRILSRGVVVHVIPDEAEFRKRLLNDRLRIYIGADPTSTALHLSHAKNYMLLEEFRRLGHEVIVLFGDFTARIGDPTGQSSTRNRLTAEQISQHVSKWVEQIRPLINFEAEDNPARILYNSDWLSKLNLTDVIELASNMTVQQMLTRDMFDKRMKEEKAIHLHEFLYPLLQGYDSVAMDVDVELCGTDQTFNALVGRLLQKRTHNRDKFVVCVHLMENPKTGELMSKSRGSGVFLDSDSKDMYGAIMKQPDEMIRLFLVNNTRLPLDDVSRIMEEPARDAKMRAALEVTTVFHGKVAAREAQDAFIKQFQKKEIPEELPTILMGASKESLLNVLTQCVAGSESKSQLRRLLQQNAVSINDQVRINPLEEIILPVDGIIIKIGKRRYFRVMP